VVAKDGGDTKKGREKIWDYVEGVVEVYSEKVLVFWIATGVLVVAAKPVLACGSAMAYKRSISVFDLVYVEGLCMTSALLCVVLREGCEEFKDTVSLFC
jgi:hypothetical protein